MESDPSPPPARTLSVIKSLTKTQEIIDFQCQDIQRQSNRISVIKTIGKSLSQEVQQVEEPVDVQQPPQHQIPQCDELVNSAPRLDEPHFEEQIPHNVPVKDSVLSSNRFSDVVKPRCYIPKKLITASYMCKEKSRENFTTPNSVIMSIDKY